MRKRVPLKGYSQYTIFQRLTRRKRKGQSVPKWGALVLGHSQNGAVSAVGDGSASPFLVSSFKMDLTRRGSFGAVWPPLPTSQTAWNGKQLFASGSKLFTQENGVFTRFYEEIPNGKAVKVVHTGRFSRCVTTHEGKSAILNLGSREFVHLGTGEVRTYGVEAQSRFDNTRELRRSMQVMRDMINCNFGPAEIAAKRVLWLTYTYDTPVRDHHQVKKDWDTFRKRLNREYGAFEYLVALEPQGENAGYRWHIHVLFLFPSNAPWIDFERMKTLWGHGTFEVGLAQTDNFGAYLSAYLTDMETGKGDSAGELKTVKGEQKRFIKGARLKLYPARMRPFRWSKGLKKPDEQKAYMSDSLRSELGERTFVTAKEIDCGKFKMVYGQEIFARGVSANDYRRSQRKIERPKEKFGESDEKRAEHQRPTLCNSSGVSGRTGIVCEGLHQDGNRERAERNLVGQFNPKHEKFFSFLNESDEKKASPPPRSSSGFSSEVLKKTSPNSSAVPSSAARILAVPSSGFGCSDLAVPPQFVHRR